MTVICGFWNESQQKQFQLCESNHQYIFHADCHIKHVKIDLQDLILVTQNFRKFSIVDDASKYFIMKIMHVVWIKYGNHWKTRFFLHKKIKKSLMLSILLNIWLEYNFLDDKKKGKIWNRNPFYWDDDNDIFPAN